MADQSTDIEIVKFIEIVKSNKILWDLTYPNHKNIKKKALVWKNISEELGLTPEICKKKWKSLRDSCLRDINRDIIKKTNSGDSTEEPEVAWKYREHMAFIREHRKSKIRQIPSAAKRQKAKAHSWNEVSKKPNTSTEMETTFLSTMESVQEFLSVPRKSKLNKTSTSDDEEDDFFCKSLVKKLKKFPIAVKNDAKLEMLRYLNSIENALPVDD
ncbi:transcription factor Adf-1-like [Episyrphus balteatus]|uniref:transcription factor Adf-1-like n=1 Tax=Episyrphus balteatus TaxID=286459 RepID=UPI0024856518|nr:transcription factor Adf-1-like [Episyrphus balteatus]